MEARYLHSFILTFAGLFGNDFRIIITSLRKFLSSISCSVSLQDTSTWGDHTMSIVISLCAGTEFSVHSRLILCSGLMGLQTDT